VCPCAAIRSSEPFAKIKYWMRLARKRTVYDPWRQIAVVATIQSTECSNCFIDAGYAFIKSETL
jgi:hypothetical protein